MIEFLIAIFLGCSPSVAAVVEPLYDELSELDLVEVLIRDDKLDLAQQELEETAIKPLLDSSRPS
ncbi:MAG: hypothetical protein IPL83_16270 [Bdellovibrionales bacterium]|nr:hypothetical protein [Bdellovibrionales bacterium]